MIEKMYGEGVFFEDAINSTYPKAYQAAIIETGIKPLKTYFKLLLPLFMEERI